MSNYELFRTSLAAQLISRIPENMLHDILSVIDNVSADYDIIRKTTDLIVYEGVPESVKLFLAAKAIEHRSSATLAGYLRHLTDFFRTVNKPVEAITTNDIRVYLFRYKETRHVVETTLETLRCTLNSYFEWMAQEEYLPKNPARRIAPIASTQKRRSAMDLLDLEKIRSACADVREKALVDFLFSTGARVSEVKAAQIDDVCFLKHSFLIRHGKGDKERTTYLNAEAEVSLSAYLASRTDSNPSLFVTTRAPHHGMSSKAIQDIIRKICSRAGVKIRITPHIFRHTTATIALRNGMPIEQVRQLLGHARLDTTLLYTDLDQQEVMNSHRKYIS